VGTQPFEAGNLARVTHGAWSPLLVDPLAEELVAAIAPTVTWWQPCDRPAVWAWGQTEALFQLLPEWSARHHPPRSPMRVAGRSGMHATDSDEPVSFTGYCRQRPQTHPA
jgi:hypothetical protein